MNDWRAVAERWIRPRLSRTQPVHLFAEDLERVADLEAVRPAVREVLREVEREEPRVVEAQVGAAASRRQKASVNVCTR